MPGALETGEFPAIFEFFQNSSQTVVRAPEGQSKIQVVSQREWHKSKTNLCSHSHEPDGAAGRKFSPMEFDYNSA